jgi:hypothetical protein
MCKHFISQFKVVQVHPVFLNPTSESKPHLMEFKHVKKQYCVQINLIFFYFAYASNYHENVSHYAHTT